MCVGLAIPASRIITMASLHFSLIYQVNLKGETGLVRWMAGMEVGAASLEWTSGRRRPPNQRRLRPPVRPGPRARTR